VDPELLEEAELARLELAILERGVDPKHEREVAAAQLKVTDLRAQQEEKRLIAPFDGEVMVLLTVAGRSVEAYEPVVVLADPSSLEIRGEPAADLMHDLHEGQPVKVVPLNHPEYRLAGAIRQLPEPFGSGGPGLLGEADTMVHVALESQLEMPGDLVQAGDLVRIIAVVEERRDVLWLHPAAIRNFAGRKFVVLREGIGRRRADVLTGVETDERVEIVGGLSLGQIVEGQ
jgi:multidrug efflux pump subunit AcrA (membrane-fusion protein)